MNGKAAAFPLEYSTADGRYVVLGMDIRTYIATACIQGLATTHQYMRDDAAAKKAVVMADQLIAELNRTEAK